jgi:hypothetical protein
MDILDESGISMENIISLLDKLPERGVRNALVELYWREIECGLPIPRSLSLFSARARG